MIRIGVIGCGYWGPLHVRVFDSLPGAAVTMVADLSPQRLAHISERYPHVATTERLDDLLAGPVDAVVVSTPAGTHAAVATQALLCDKHVLVEKPLATEVAAAEALVALAAARGRTLMSGHTFVYHAAVRELRRLLVAGELGRLLYIDSARLNLGLHRKDVDVVWDLAAHDIAILRFILNADPLSARAHGAAFHDPGVAEVAYLELRYPGAVLANLHVSWLDPVKVRRMTFVGDRRMAVWDDVEAVAKLRVYDRGMERRPYYDDFGAWQVAYRFGEGEVVPLDFAEPLRLQAEEFLRAIDAGDAPLTSGADGLAVVRTLARATAALRIGPVNDAEDEANDMAAPVEYAIAARAPGSGVTPGLAAEQYVGKLGASQAFDAATDRERDTASIQSATGAANERLLGPTSGTEQHAPTAAVPVSEAVGRSETAGRAGRSAAGETQHAEANSERTAGPADGAER